MQAEASKVAGGEKLMSNGTVTIINTTSYKLQPVPEVGKEYHIFDDGKIRPSRHELVVVDDIIAFKDCCDKKLIRAWKQEVEECCWLYAKETDYIIKASTGENKLPRYFVRTVDGGWFSINYPRIWGATRLDLDGSLYKQMKECYNIEE
jgi:hypothetical protein